MKKNIIYILLISMISCQTKTKTDKEETNHFILEKTLYDFKDILNNKSSSTVFKFSNGTEIPIIIKDIKTSCSCTVAKWDSDTIRKNQTGTIKITYNPNELGPFVNLIDIYYNEITIPKKLMIKGNVISE